MVTKRQLLIIIVVLMTVLAGSIGPSYDDYAREKEWPGDDYDPRLMK